MGLFQAHQKCRRPSDKYYICAMKMLDGKIAAQAIKDKLKIDVAQLAAEGKKIPHLAAILVGDNGASETYVAAKVKACAEVGFKSSLIKFEKDLPAQRLLKR